jgi:hypothetical protein
MTEGELSPAQVQRSAKDVLVSWANEQDGWVRAIVAEVIVTRRELSAAALEAAKEHFLLEKQLAEGSVPEVAPLGDGSPAMDAAEPLRLVSLTECRGVNALVEDQSIFFNPRLTILFGENAVGKTGYVRVLKRMANVRSAEVILPDVHRPTRGVRPHALMRYAVGGSELQTTWNDEQGVQPFTRISVFDSPAVALHLEDNVTYLYTPADLALFKYVHTGIEGVRSLLEEDASSRLPRQNPFLTAFTRGTAVYPKIEALGASSNLTELEQLATVGEADKAELDSLRVAVEALSSPAGEGGTQSLRTRAAILRNLIAVCEAIVRFDLAGLTEATVAEARATEQLESAAAAVFSGGELAANVRPAWQAFLEAGERYLVTSGEAEYPTRADTCIYCRQRLDEAAQELLAAYRRYASGDATSAVSDARELVARLREPLLAPATQKALDGLRVTLGETEISAQTPDWMADARRLLDESEPVLDAVAQGRTPAQSEVTALAASLLPRIRAAANEDSVTIHALEGDAKQRAQALVDDRARIALLEARLALARLFPEIRQYVQQAVMANALGTLLARFQGLLRSLTDASKIASHEILNRDFERLFFEECEALRAPNVTLDFPGRRGEAARRKSVVPNHSLTDILSQGEQKVIAIADFLAEAALRGGAAPIVFDDPVDSFDHRRITEIARRMAALSSKNQVIVFTHDIWFAAELLGEFEDAPSDSYSYYQISEDGGYKGLVSQTSHPRTDSVASIRKRVNEAIQGVQAAPSGDRQRLIELAYDHIRSWCEVAVETELLAKTVRRFQPNIAMQRVRQIRPDRLQAAVDVIYPIWDKSNRYVPAHSQPLAALGVRPTLDELKDDWAELQSALKAYSGD